MRLFGSFGIFVSLCFSIQAQVSPSVTEVRQKLRSIELESYLSAYKDATVNLRELEEKLVMPNSTESRAFLEQNRKNLSKHLDTLAARTIEIAQQIEQMKAATTAKEKLPDGTRVYLQNRLQQTGRDLDIAIEGRGFLQAVDDAKTGENVYARVCNLDIDANGHMVLGSSRSGLLLSPSISIPQDAIAIVFTEKGEVNCRVAGETNLRTMGQIQLAQFSNPEGLFEIAENLFAETEASGPATLAKPGQEGAGIIRQGNIEVSDSNRVRELVGLLVSLLTAEYHTESLRPR